MAEHEDGLLIESEGTVYFIPAADLANYRLPEERAGRVVAAIEEQVGDEVSGFAASGRPLRPDVRQLRAFQGPLGVRVPTPGSEEDTVIIR